MTAQPDPIIEATEVVAAAERRLSLDPAVVGQFYARRLSGRLEGVWAALRRWWLSLSPTEQQQYSVLAVMVAVSLFEAVLARITQT
jgi:hypothetical protein